MTGRLLLVPVPLGEAAAWADCVPTAVLQHVINTDHFIAERAKTARAFMKQLALRKPLAQLSMTEFNEHSLSQDAVRNAQTLKALLQPALDGQDVIYMSEAGCPAVADPGEQLVAAAQQMGLTVVPQIGPSAILLTLMGSGFNGQQFAFHSYLPADPIGREKMLIQLEAQSATPPQRTALWIETPYRTQAMFETALAALKPTTRLCIGCDVTLPTMQITTLTIAQWRKRHGTAPLQWQRRLVVFALAAA